jgi:hypothetical protein
MLSLSVQAALLLSLAVPNFAQISPDPNRFKSEIPQAEAQKLTQIVEDQPDAVPGGSARKGGNSSPAYTLYSAALPIPPVAQVKQ